jgi:hypothetical protein
MCLFTRSFGGPSEFAGSLTSEQLSQTSSESAFAMRFTPCGGFKSKSALSVQRPESVEPYDGSASSRVRRIKLKGLILAQNERWRRG